MTNNDEAYDRLGNLLIDHFEKTQAFIAKHSAEWMRAVRADKNHDLNDAMPAAIIMLNALSEEFGDKHIGFDYILPRVLNDLSFMNAMEITGITSLLTKSPEYKEAMLKGF